MWARGKLAAIVSNATWPSKRLSRPRSWRLRNFGEQNLMILCVAAGAARRRMALRTAFGRKEIAHCPILEGVHDPDAKDIREHRPGSLWVRQPAHTRARAIERQGGSQSSQTKAHQRTNHNLFIALTRCCMTTFQLQTSDSVY